MRKNIHSYPKEDIKMAEVHNFRSAFHGFNREDVVRYITYINNKHNDQVNQLNSEKRALAEELAALRAQEPVEDLSEVVAQLETERDELRDRCAQLEAQLAAASAAKEAVVNEAELEAYRRAERMERAAKERAEQIYQQAVAALADATTQVDGAAIQFQQLSERINSQMAELQAAVEGSKAALVGATATMYAIRPEGEDAE
jgi:TolA-binding protein